MQREFLTFLSKEGAGIGDGITPTSAAHLDGAEQREVAAIHIGFVPGLGTRLCGTRSRVLVP